MIHIHRGGTLQTYCGASIAGFAWAGNIQRPHVLRTAGRIVGWEQASEATCPDCRGHFVGFGL